MWIKLKNGELFNLNYADKIYSVKLSTGKYAVCIRKKIFFDQEASEILRVNDGFEEEEANEQVDNLFHVLTSPLYN